MKNFLKILIPSALFLLTIFVVGTNLSKPFWGTHDWNGARYGNIAKNYLRYGLIQTKLGQVENGGMVSPANFIYYTHYQPLLPLLISASYYALGVSEFSTRAVPLIATAGLIIIIYFIGAELFNWQMGLFAALSALFTPMVRYYGKNPVHEPLALFFAALVFLGALIYKKGHDPEQSRRGWTLLVTGFILTALTNWSFVFLLPALTLFLFERKNRKKLIFLWILTTILIGLQFLHAKILTGSFLGGGLGDAFLERTSIDNVALKFSVFQYISQIRLWSSTLFTNTLLASSLFGLILLVRSKPLLIKMFILSTFIYCIYPIFFANASFVHSYFIYYFVLPLSLLAGYFCARLYEYKKILTILILGILIGVWFERNDYVKALNESTGDKLAVEVANNIMDKASSTDMVLVEPYDYAYSRLPILTYYSERNIVYDWVANWDVKITGEKYAITKIKN